MSDDYADYSTTDRLLAEIRDELRGIRYALEAQAEPAEEDAPIMACPFCSEGAGDRLEDTSTSRGKRTTCLSCGKSFGPGAEEVRADG